MNFVKKEICTNQDASDMVRLYKEQRPEVGSFDTETTGLHIILDRPFMFQFAWLSTDHKTIWSYVIDIWERPKLAAQVIHAWRKMSGNLKKLLGHNVTFDMNMLANIGEPLGVENISDTMFYIRLAHDALQERKGGPPLKLKAYCAQYIDRAAAFHEKLLDTEKTDIAKVYNLKLKSRMGKPWTLGSIKDFFKDQVKDYTDLPEADQKNYLDWYHYDLPEGLRKHVHGKVESDDIPFYMLNRKNLKQYAHMDVILPLLIYIKLQPVIIARKNEYALNLEELLIFPFYEMVRNGFHADKQYLIESKERMKQYIIRRRAHLFELAGQEFKISQHELIKTLVFSRFGVQLNTTNADELTILESKLRRENDMPELVDFISTLQELRTLEKWYSTYIIRFLDNLNETDRLYTSINSVGAVSLRITSDFQQFPREGITTIDGDEIFTPRKLVIPTGGDYPGLVYIDYSQIELRLQAMYTILVNHPEPNLCRAYMPYGCINAEGRLFDPENKQDILHWKDEWFEKDGTRWKPIDVHAQTTCFAFDITSDDPEFKHFRSDGKKLNFMKNYGGGMPAVMRSWPQYDEARWKKMNEAYYKAFPGVLYYHDYCNRVASMYSHAINLFGVRYYNVSGHDLINMLIQGSGATLLKIKIRLIYDYMKNYKIKSRFQMDIHDELSWERYKGDGYNVFLKFKQMMEDWEDTLVPLIAEMSYSTTTWAQKKEVKGVEDFEEKIHTIT